jgi:CheY-like chemotaxis protein
MVTGEHAIRRGSPRIEGAVLGCSSPLRVFLAEDNEGDVFLVRRALQKNEVDYELMVARNGEEALEFVTEAENGVASDMPDIFVLDLNLPRCDGIQILTRIRNSASFPDAPVIILTSSDSPHDRRYAMEGGANGYFRKPNDLDGFMKLGAVIRDVARTAHRG